MQASFFSSYVAADSRAAAFLPPLFRDPAARLARVRACAERPVSPELLAVLAEEDRALPPSEARRANLAALASPGTAAVITGQQVGLFLGPLYTVYKAASAVAAARAIEAESGVRCVPIFWLQTEDHDFAEIDHCFVPQKGAPPFELKLAPDSLGAVDPRTSVAQRRLGDDVTALLDELAALLDRLPHSGECLALYRAHYRPGRSLASAFAGVLAELFAGEGLVLFDPRRAEVARLSAAIHRRAVGDCEAISALLEERGRALAAAGFSEQVHVRAGSPLSFFHLDRADGPRVRLVVEDGRGATGFATVGGGGVVGAAELTSALERDPLRFSSSALLRPIVQDSLFPTVAYVGGPAEVGYFAQLAPLYAHFGLRLPLVVPRARFRCVDGPARALLDKLQLRPAEVELPRDELERRLAAPVSAGLPAPAELEARLLGPLAAELDALEAKLPSLDAGLAKPLRRTRETVTRGIARFVGRYARAQLDQDRATQERLDRLRYFLFPDGTPQERVYALPYFAARFGARTFKDALLAALRPFEPDVQELSP